MNISTVKDLKKALENVPDEMELVIGLHGNQHDAREAGVAILQEDGMYDIPENKRQRRYAPGRHKC